MVFDFEKTMKEVPDAELIRIVFTNRNEYQEAAIAAAEAELSTRNLSSETLSFLEQKQIAKNTETAYKAELPLELHWKIVAFLFPGVFQLIIAGFFKGNGFDRKANEVGKWTFFGLFFYIAVVIYSAL
jgi:lipopolysaccharide export LptBFGC system permease protein LptF